MPFITRLTRLLRADLHALLDRLEAPDLVLAQAIREMEQALAEERDALRGIEQEIGRLERRLAELERVRVQAQEGLDECLAAGREDLARPLIRRGLEAERQAGALGQRCTRLQEERTRRARRLEERSERLADLRARASLFESEEEPERAPDAADPWEDTGPGIRESDVELALLQAKRRRGMPS